MTPLHHWMEKPQGILQPVKRQSGAAHLPAGLIEDNETSSPLRQNVTEIWVRFISADTATETVYQTNCPKKPQIVFPCNVYLKALVNRCCWIWSWAWHGFSIWFTAMLRLNSSLWFLTVNLLGLGSLFQIHSKCHYEIYCKRKVCLTHTQTHTQLYKRACQHTHMSTDSRL